MFTVDHTESIDIRLVGARPRHTFTAHPWRIPNHDAPFHALPSDTTRLVIQREECLFRNGEDDKRREAVQLEEAQCWGYNDEKSVIFARASGTYCLRFIFNAAYVLQNTHLEPYQAYERLVADAKFHSHHLDVLEGRIVPRHYGMWMMDTGRWAGKVLLSVTDYCGVSWHELKHSHFSTKANRERIGRTLEMMHDLGVNHGDMSHDMRHVLLDIHEPGLVPADGDLHNGRIAPYVTGFSAATIHKCRRRLPIVPLDAFPKGTENDCCEVLDFLCHLDFVKLVKPHASSLVMQAIEWHDKYTAEYPDEDPADVMVAQRVLVFKECPSIYPDILVRFVPGPRIARVQISVISDDLQSDEDTEVGSPTDSASLKTVAAIDVTEGIKQLTLHDTTDPILV
ncbi:hypothetical protein FB45DRAFT_913805 [Roridomyces roridus]|uniref:Uncharacterized protein n=1 Tax=Roridomyces roridus TaxID=1738132 RepID=A0AAD7BXE2_9AGAR|nr:hypothetical protein FB45DRAFT_913805 [Roridomyces roridus]